MACFKSFIRIASSKSEYQRKFVFSFKKLQIKIVFPKDSSILLVWNSTTVADAISNKMCFKRAESIFFKHIPYV